MNDVTNGVISVAPEPTVIHETVATALVDGQNLLGPVVGNECMKLAIQKARQAGIGWVAARSNIRNSFR